MKIGLISSFLPLVFGGGRNIVDWLDVKLKERGYSSEVIYLPSTDAPESILEQMAAFRMLQLDDYFDRVITFRPPSHVVRHRCKVVWFIHHIRMYYDLWNTVYSPMSDTAPWRALRAAVMRADTVALREAHHIFTNSNIVNERLVTFNGLRGDVLYPPILHPELFTSREYGDEIVCVSRIEHHKRQQLLVDAMKHTHSGVRLHLSGVNTIDADYIPALRKQIHKDNLRQKVFLEDRWVSEQEKADRLSRALACAYVPYNEDSYGYCTIEAAHSRRCTVTTTDAGGVLEFVTDGADGLVVAPEPEALADAFDRLYEQRGLAQQFGEAAHGRLDDLRINWDTVIEKLLA